MATFRALSGPPGMPPIGGRIVIDGIKEFAAASDLIVRRFGEIDRAARRLGQTNIPGLGNSTAYSRVAMGPFTAYARLPGTLGLITAAGAGASAAILALGANFQKTTRAVEVFTDVTESNIGRVSRATIELSRDFTTGANKIQKGVVTLGKAGAPVADLNSNIVKTATLFSQASQGELSVSDASRILVQTLTAQNLAWDQATNVADAFTGVVQNTVTEFDDLNAVLTQALPVATELGYTYKDVAVAYGLMRQGGLGANVASTAFKNALLALADPTKEQLEIMEKYNISLFDADKKALPLVEVLGRLGDAFGKTSEGARDAQSFFDLADLATTRTVLGLSILGKQGPEAFAKLYAAANVSTEQIAKDLQDNVIDQLTILGNQAQAAALVLSGPLVNSLTNVATQANAAIRENTLSAFEDLGEEINRVATLQDDFARQLVVNLSAGPVGAVQILGRAFKMDLGDEIKNLKAVILDASRGFSMLIIGGAIAVEMLREEIQKISDQDIFEPHNMRDLQNFIDLILQVVAAAQAAHFILAEMIQGVTTAEATTFESAFNRFYAELRTGFESVFSSVESGTARTAANTGNAIVNIANDFAARLSAAAATIFGAQEAAAAEFQRTAVFGPMSNSMGFWDLPGVLPSTKPPIRIPTRVGGGSTFPSAGGGGGGSGKEDIDKIAARIRQMLNDLPAMNMELAKFLAGIVQDFPSRLGPIVSTLLGMRDSVGQLAIAKADLLQTDMQLMEVEERLTDLGLEQGAVEIAQARALIGYDKQLLGLKHELLSIDRQTWPIRDQLLQIERQLSDTNRTNFAQRREQLLIEQQSIGIKREIRDLEEKITKAVDRRQQLLSRREEIGAEKTVAGLRRNLTKTEKTLEEAWSKFDVPTIIKLEEQKAQIEESLQAAEDKLNGIQEAQADISRETELTTIAYELEKLALEEQLEPYTKKAQLLEDIIEDQRLQNEITSTYLEEEKQRLELLLRPYEDQQRALQRIIAEVEFLRAAAALEFEERKLGIQEMILAEKARQNELEITRRAQGVLFGELVQGFIDSLIQSETFTTEEAVEVAKRLQMWDEQTAKLIETKIQFGFLRGAADAYKESLDAIPRRIDIEIVTRHVDVYGDGSSTVGSATASAAEANSRAGVNITNNNTTNFNVDASYSQTQSPASIRMDMQAMVMMAAR